MTEGLSERRLDELGKLLKLRVAAGKPPSDEIDFVMREIVPPETSNILSKHVGNREKAFKALSGYQSVFQENKNLPRVSKPHLCASFLITNVYEVLYEVCWDMSKELSDSNKVRLFRFLYDFETGIGFSLSRIVDAEEEIAGKAEDGSTRRISAIGEKYGVPMGVQIETYLGQRSADKESAGFLTKDPSGFSLMDDSVERAKTGLSSDIDPSQATEYIVAGAEVSRDLYKELYGIAAPLYPEQQ